MISATEFLRPDNMKLQHDIPLGTFVEVDIFGFSPYNGVRAFVAEHTRDCDGESMYALSLNPDVDSNQFLKELNYKAFHLTVKDGFTKECLKIIREAK